MLHAERQGRDALGPGGPRGGAALPAIGDKVSSWPPRCWSWLVKPLAREDGVTPPDLLGVADSVLLRARLMLCLALTRVAFDGVTQKYICFNN
jgi:hypothetical protein